jgi:hypothetical protein
MVTVTVLVSAVTLLVNPCWAMITAYINERFATGIRASGFGLGYSLAVVIPSFYAFYQGLLGHVMSATYTALPLLVIGGLLITIGGAMGPETRDVDLGDVYETGGTADMPAASGREPRFTREGEGVGTGAREREGATVAMTREDRFR